MEREKGRGKRGLWKLIFGRTTFFVLSLALQIAAFVWLYLWLDGTYRTYGQGFFFVISALLAIRILNEKQNPSFKMAWLGSFIPGVRRDALYFHPAPDGDKDPGQADFGYHEGDGELSCAGTGRSGAVGEKERPGGQSLQLYERLGRISRLQQDECEILSAGR